MGAKKHGEQWGAPRLSFFVLFSLPFFFFPAPWEAKGQPDTMRLLRCAAGDLQWYICVVFSGWGEIRTTTRISTQGGTSFPAGDAESTVHLINQQSVRCQILSTGDMERRNAVLGQQPFFRAGVVERGGAGQGAFASPLGGPRERHKLRKVDRCGARQLRCSVM